jgi:sugar phosphate isomerase/epimerase
MRTAVQLGFNGHGILERLPETDLPGALRLVDAAGFDGVEVMSNVAGEPEAVKVFVERGTRVAALHLFLSDLDVPGAIARWSETMSAMRCDTLALSAFGMDQSVDGYRGLAKRLAEVQDDLLTRGQRLYFHCHSAELAVIGPDGRRGVHVMTEVVPDLRLVIDTHWTAVAGLDPARFIVENAHRSGYYHLKDGDGSAGAVFGEGSVPLRSCLSAALTRRVDWVVLEQDRPAPDIAGAFRLFQHFVKDAKKE